MKHTNKKSSGMKRHMFLLPIFLVAVVACILGAFAPGVWADDELEFEDTEFNIEFNSTDEDLGVRAFVDGEPWKELEIEDPNDNTIVRVRTDDGMELQGKAEYFFESGEPQLWVEASPAFTFEEFFDRFPEGTYEFEGETIEGDDIEGEAEFTHVIPCGPVVDVNVLGSSKVTVSWNEVTEVVDAEESDETESVVCADPVDLGLDPLEIEEYLVIFEGEDNDTELQFNVPDDVTEVEIPQYLLGEGSEYKVEILAVEESGNQSITEKEFGL